MPVDRVVRSVRDAVRTHRLLERGDRVLVAVSGGPDSVALLSVLIDMAPSMELEIGAAHVHHGLRGLEADADEAFVAAMARRLGVPCCRERLNLAFRLVKGQSRQAIAREARYAALQDMAQRGHWTKVALGHTQDDQAETVLLRLLRGAGTRGMAGMPWLRPPMFVRPLLTVSRAGLLEYLSGKALTYRRDSSNDDTVYLRNRLRRQVLPVLNAFNPAMRELLARQAEISGEEDRYLDACADRELEKLVRLDPSGALALAMPELSRLPLAMQRRVIRRTMQRVTRQAYPPTFATVSAVLRWSGGNRHSSVLSIAGVRIRRRGERLSLEGSSDLADERVDASALTVPLIVPSTVVWPPTRQHITVDLLHWGPNRLEDAMSLAAKQALIDADRVRQPLYVRTWRVGDRMAPLGLEGRHKKLQDLFVDAGVPADLRRRLPIVVAPDGIVWVPGCRIDHRVRVTPETTRVLQLKVAEGPVAETRA